MQHAQISDKISFESLARHRNSPSAIAFTRPQLGGQELNKHLSDIARAKIELVNLIRDLENKVADANHALDRTRGLLSELERVSPEPRSRSWD